MKFEQGVWYSFLIIGLTIIPEKGEHFILVHESGRKMLMRTEYYIKYNLSIGQIIQCRVDKVNCTGQVFLEPKHPYYNEGEVYEFELIKSYSDDSFYNTRVQDIFNNEIDIYLIPNNDSIIGQPLSLKVIRVKKGIPILSELVKESEGITQEKSEVKLFIKTIISYNSEDFYILSDGNRITARIKVKYFKKYGFEIGDEIVCNVIRNEPIEILMVEPQNPWYKIGNVYLFKNLGVEEYTDLEGKKAKVLVVLDLIDNKCGVLLDEKLENQLQNKKEIKCKVVGFRKGRPQLEIDSS